LEDGVLAERHRPVQHGVAGTRLMRATSEAAPCCIPALACCGRTA
jgi:hypothetical protein